MRKLILLFIFLLTTGSCKSPVNDLRKDVEKLMNSEIVIPNTLLSRNISREEFMQKQQMKYKIIVYFDEDECTDCNLKSLLLWKGFIASLPEDVSLFVYTILNTTMPAELISRMAQYHYDLPYFIDINGDFKRENINLSERTELHTLLIKDDKVRVIGSPIDNSKILALYRNELENK